MTIMRKLAVPATVAVLLFTANIAPEPSRHLLGIQLIGDANAIFGVRRRTRRRSAAAGYWAGSAAASNAYCCGLDAPASQPSTPSQDSDTTQSSTTAEHSDTEKHSDATEHSTTAETLPLGSVVTSLPGQCTKKPSGGIEYYYCAPNYYRAVFQGNSLVYVTAKP